MFGYSLPAILLILLIVVLVFGAGKLPEIGAGLGKGISNFKKSLQEGKENEKLDKDKDDSAG